MNKTTYVGLDVHKDTITVAVAEEGRRGETRFFGTIAHTADSVLRLTKQLAAAGNTPSFCYEAGPCGYGLYRQLIDDGLRLLCGDASTASRRTTPSPATRTAGARRSGPGACATRGASASTA